MRNVKILLSLCCILSFALLVACSSNPEYLNPYGEGVDPSTITTVSYVSPTTNTTTGLVIRPTTSTAPTTVPTRVAVLTDDVVICPDCKGVLTYCEYCKGLTKRYGEMLDPDSGIYKKYSQTCNVCDEDPGFAMCQTCHNELVVPK